MPFMNAEMSASCLPFLPLCKIPIVLLAAVLLAMACPSVEIPRLRGTCPRAARRGYHNLRSDMQLNGLAWTEAEIGLATATCDPGYCNIRSWLMSEWGHSRLGRGRQ